MAITLSQAKEDASKANVAKPLFRGEEGHFKNTYSAHHRLFQGPRFTQAQKIETAKRMVWIAQTLQLVLQHEPVFADPISASKHAGTPSPNKMHQVLYGFLQHYHLATPFIDVTTNLDVACSFCVSEKHYEKPQPVRLYVIDSEELEACGLRVTGGYTSRSPRHGAQEALSIYLPHKCDFQRTAKNALISIIDAEVTESERQKFYRADLYDATNDEVAHEVASLAYRCAYGDWAPDHPSLGRVQEYFAEVFDKLRDAGVGR